MDYFRDFQKKICFLTLKRKKERKAFKTKKLLIKLVLFSSKFALNIVEKEII